MSAQGSSQTVSLPVVLLTSLYCEYQSVLGNTNMVIGDQFVLELLLEQPICDFFCQRRALSECPHQLPLRSFLCDSLACQFSQMRRQSSQYLN